MTIDEGGAGRPERQAEYENTSRNNYQKFVLKTGYKGFVPLPDAAVHKEAVDQGSQKPSLKPKKKRE